MSTCLWTVAMICSSTVFVHAQTLQFLEETIEVEVHGTYCILTGTYTFKNHTANDLTWGIFYPLLSHSELPFPDSISVYDLDGECDVPFTTSREGIGFQARTPSAITSTYRISYRQQTPSRMMEYILTTTEKWGRPLERATFRISIPDSLQLVALSIPWNNIERIGGCHVYHIYKTNFLPTENLTVHWRRQQP